MQRTKHVTMTRHMRNKLSRMPVVGFTCLSDNEIISKGMTNVISSIWICDESFLEAEDIIADFGCYHLVSRNCRHYAELLITAIISYAIEEPDASARYCFTHDTLLFLGCVELKGSRAGWILPRPDKILVHVSPTQDPTTWEGEVLGSDERGLFFSAPCIFSIWPLPFLSQNGFLESTVERV
jgi:hypothetical protein